MGASHPVPGQPRATERGDASDRMRFEAHDARHLGRTAGGAEDPGRLRMVRGSEGNVMARARLQLALSLLATLPLTTPGFAGDDSTEAWAALVKGGHVAVIRHGNAPPGYGGDPPGFRFDDCKTQRNLDDVGRGQARALGEAFRKRGVRVDRIVSSPVCRCLETGQLMAVGPVETSWSLLPDRAPSTVRAQELKEMVSSWRGPGTLVLVTHALTAGPLGFFLEQAETVVLRPAPGHPPGGHVVGRIPSPE